MMAMSFLKEKLARSKTFVGLLGTIPDAVIQWRKKPKILIEVTNICNLKCPLCPTANTMSRSRGFMSLPNFKVIVDEIKDIKSLITMNFAGEPTLNKDLFKMVSYASENGMKTMVSTNGTSLHNFDSKDIVNSGLTQLVFSVDGITQETLGKYRVGANLTQIMANLRSVVAMKDELHSEFPVIDWQFIVMEHNQHEIPKLMEMAEDIGVDRLILKSVGMSMGYDFSKDEVEEIEQRTGIFLASEGYSKQRTHNPIQICPWIWDSVILWNGDVTTCCFDFNGEAVVGNVFRDGFKKTWGSKKYVDTRKKILRKELRICRTCRRLEESGNLKQVIVLKKHKDAIPTSYS